MPDSHQGGTEIEEELCEGSMIPQLSISNKCCSVMLNAKRIGVCLTDACGPVSILCLTYANYIFFLSPKTTLHIL